MIINNPLKLKWLRNGWKLLYQTLTRKRMFFSLLVWVLIFKVSLFPEVFKVCQGTSILRHKSFVRAAVGQNAWTNSDTKNLTLFSTSMIYGCTVSSVSSNPSKSHLISMDHLSRILLLPKDTFLTTDCIDLTSVSLFSKTNLNRITQ